MRDSKIHSADDFRKAVFDAEEKVKKLKAEKDSLTKKIADEEKLIGDIPKYLEILKRGPLLPKDISELAKYNYLKDAGITSLEDADGKIREAVSEKKTVSDFYALYENQMKSDYQILLEQAKAEMGNIRREEERQKAEKERSDLQAENKMQDRDRSGFSR